ESCGIARGDTNDVASTRRKPASMKPRMNATFFSVGTNIASDCNPSRVPTSVILIALGYISSRLHELPGLVATLRGAGIWWALAFRKAPLRGSLLAYPILEMLLVDSESGAI